MKKLLILLTLFCICSGAFAQSKTQIHWGLEAGYDHGWVKLTDSGTFGEPFVIESAQNGFHVGPMVSFDFLPGKHVPSLTLALNYQFLASEYPLGSDKAEYLKACETAKSALQEAGMKNVDYQETDCSHAIQIPIMVKYTYKPTQDWGVSVFTGPMLNFFAARYTKDVMTWTENGLKNGLRYDRNWLADESWITVWNNGEKIREQDSDPTEDKISKFFNFYWNVGVGCSYKNFVLSLTYEACIEQQAWYNFGGATNQTLVNNVLNVGLAYLF